MEFNGGCWIEVDHVLTKEDINNPLIKPLIEGFDIKVGDKIEIPMWVEYTFFPPVQPRYNPFGAEVYDPGSDADVDLGDMIFEHNDKPVPDSFLTDDELDAICEKVIEDMEEREWEEM